MAFVRGVAGGVDVAVKVVPGASRSRVVGMLGDALKVAVSAAPEKGKANAAVVELMAKELGVAAQDVSVVRGLTQPRKVIRVRGVTVEYVEEKLG